MGSRRWRRGSARAITRPRRARGEQDPRGLEPPAQAHDCTPAPRAQVKPLGRGVLLLDAGALPLPGSRAMDARLRRARAYRRAKRHTLHERIHASLVPRRPGPGEGHRQVVSLSQLPDLTAASRRIGATRPSSPRHRRTAVPARCGTRSGWSGARTSAPRTAGS